MFSFTPKFAKTSDADLVWAFSILRNCLQRALERHVFVINDTEITNGLREVAKFPPRCFSDRQAEVVVCADVHLPLLQAVGLSPVKLLLCLRSSDVQECVRTRSAFSEGARGSRLFFRELACLSTDRERLLARVT